jgi:general secretion pathway protein A
MSAGSGTFYQELYGLKHRPFALTPDPDFLYLTPSHREALDRLEYGIEEGFGFLVLTGEVGLGKTTLVHALLARLPAHFETAYILDPALRFPEILAMVLEDLGVKTPSAADKGELLTTLHRFLLEEHARGRDVLLVVDEAQHLSVENLEALRMLANLETGKRKLVHILLVGQPELAAVLAQPQLRQLAQRIGVQASLRPLTRDETGAYVMHRLRAAGAASHHCRFDERAIERVHRHSGGVPRLINRVCHAALVAGFVAGARVLTAAHVDQGWRELAATADRRERGPRRGRRRLERLAWILALVCAALLAHFTVLGAP